MGFLSSALEAFQFLFLQAAAGCSVPEVVILCTLSFLVLRIIYPGSLFCTNYPSDLEEIGALVLLAVGLMKVNTAQ